MGKASFGIYGSLYKAKLFV